MARVITVPACVSKFAKLIGFKNIGFASAKINDKINNPRRAGSDPVSPPLTLKM
jgi:hypothetical protein